MTQHELLERAAYNDFVADYAAEQREYEAYLDAADSMLEAERMDEDEYEWFAQSYEPVARTPARTPTRVSFAMTRPTLTPAPVAGGSIAFTKEDLWG